MDVEQLDTVLVPLGLALMGLYHVWLVITVKRNPRFTIIGLNVESRQQWIFCLMADPLKNGVLAVQTIRNNIMASTLLATTAITLCSIISVFFVSSTSNPVTTSSRIVYGNKTAIISAITYFTLMLSSSALFSAMSSQSALLPRAYMAYSSSRDFVEKIMSAPHGAHQAAPELVDGLTDELENSIQPKHSGSDDWHYNHIFNLIYAIMRTSTSFRLHSISRSLSCSLA